LVWKWRCADYTLSPNGPLKRFTCRVVVASI
jgi:hypothetical protein